MTLLIESLDPYIVTVKINNNLIEYVTNTIVKNMQEKETKHVDTVVNSIKNLTFTNKKQNIKYTQQSNTTS